MADPKLDLNAALIQLAEYKAGKEKAEAETQTVRTKLHSAVRKGKAIEAERASLARKIEQLASEEPKVRTYACGCHTTALCKSNRRTSQ